MAERGGLLKDEGANGFIYQEPGKESPCSVTICKTTLCTDESRRTSKIFQGNCQDPDRRVGACILSPNCASGIQGLENPADLQNYRWGKDDSPYPPKSPLEVEQKIELK